MCGFLLSSSSSYWPGFHENRCLLNGCEIILHGSGSLGSDIVMPKNPEGLTRHQEFTGDFLAKRLSCKVGSALRFHHHLHFIHGKKTLRYAVICSGNLFTFFLSSLKHGFRKTSHFLGLKKTANLAFRQLPYHSMPCRIHADNIDPLDKAPSFLVTRGEKHLLCRNTQKQWAYHGKEDLQHSGVMTLYRKRRRGWRQLRLWYLEQLQSRNLCHLLQDRNTPPHPSLYFQLRSAQEETL